MVLLLHFNSKQFKTLLVPHDVYQGLHSVAAFANTEL